MPAKTSAPQIAVAEFETDPLLLMKTLESSKYDLILGKLHRRRDSLNTYEITRTKSYFVETGN